MLCVLALLSAVAPLATDMYLPGLPEVSDDLGATASSVQLTITTFLAGLAIGQLVIGPLSDGIGRRRLLIGGTALCAVAGVLCATAPTVEVLVATRFLQGFSGAAGIVLARAVIADRASGTAAAKLFSVMMIIGGVAPVMAPLAGGALIGPIGWRGVFWVLTGLAVVMLVGVLLLVPETLPADRRHGAGFAALARNARYVLTNRRFLGYTLVFASGFGALFSYISQSTFVVQDLLGLSPGMFSVVFACNAAGLVGANIINTRLIGRVSPRRLLTGGVTALTAAGVLLLAVVTVGGSAQWALLGAMFCVTASIGFIFGNATALAQAQVPRAAGTGSAVMGALQFTVGAAVSPLVGIAGPDTAVPMAISILVMGVAATTALHTLARAEDGSPGAAGQPVPAQHRAAQAPEGAQAAAGVEHP
ncbi:multidrug effflux MFS transporter [Rhodococcus sp. X156]|uniref:multidrug effflux MFS transporter n=1 Tax=Rhodococcus sp. X156 TaxID=2499145 RepID=UPI000FD87F11|nr:multidrug effflux MFS transporter [Rhodococcus sp. X156]